jgi:1,4-alpha-glucan branching enzyme
MPVAQFPGERNWGYDGVQPFAVHNSYGGPAGLMRLVDACHARGIAVVLDVVYNHMGPEGNYLGEFGPYFTEKYKTPWGPAVNVDEAHSDEVRRFFIDNALEWLTDYHIDALRLDAVHGDLKLSQSIYDHVDGIARRLGADPADQVPFEKYAKAAESLLKPSSAARAVASGAPFIERVDLLVKLVSDQLGAPSAEIDRTVQIVDHKLNDRIVPG